LYCIQNLHLLVNTGLLLGNKTLVTYYRKSICSFIQVNLIYICTCMLVKPQTCNNDWLSFPSWRQGFWWGMLIISQFLFMSYFNRENNFIYLFSVLGYSIHALIFSWFHELSYTCILFTLQKYVLLFVKFCVLGYRKSYWRCQTGKAFYNTSHYCQHMYKIWGQF